MQLDLIESIEVYNNLHKKLDSQLDKEFIVEVLKVMYGNKNSEGNTKQNKETNQNNIEEEYF
jgi:adenine C2-methylase RlmN of 23S rRNA A2503 and tRNA A37